MKKYRRRFLKISAILCAAAVLPGVLQFLVLLCRAGLARVLNAAGSVGITGGADGPTAFFTTVQFAPALRLIFRGLMLLAATGCAARWLAGKRK